MADRRRFLGAAGATAMTLAAGRALAACASARPYSGAEDPFTLGVASGEPRSNGVVLWTRLAPEPLDGGGMAPTRIAVEWQVAGDESFTRVVRRGSTEADPSLAHSVHVEVDGLRPASWYFYRFRSGEAVSPVGRTRTAPAGAADRLRLAVASCQNYEQGLYTAYRHMAAEDLDLVVHVGDYIYEGGRHPERGGPRIHNSDKVTTLEAYRNRYALYKSDPALQAAHAAFPWATTWDDHEVKDNYTGAEDAADKAAADAFRARRAAAYQAYYEHLPLRPAQRPDGAALRLYRHLAFGDLAALRLLDTRQYRSGQPCGGEDTARCAAAFDPAATMTGAAQERWLLDGLAAERARWKVLPQQVPMFQYDVAAGPGATYDMDGWDGYPAARDRLLGFAAAHEISDLVVLTGDDHEFWAADLKADFDDQRSPTVGAEFVTTSISSGGDGTETSEKGQLVLAENPHVHYHNKHRGYLRCELTPALWRTDIRTVAVVSAPGAPIATKASFVVEAGRAGLTTG